MLRPVDRTGDRCGNVIAVTPASLVLTAAIVAWGSVVPPLETVPPADAAESEAATATTPADQPVAPSPPAPAPPAAPAAIQTPIVVKAPVYVRPAPALVATPRRKEQLQSQLYRRWFFWAIAGGFLAATIVVTYAATRPGPQPYTGNAPPYYVPFP
jgi:hypothetical protein